MKKAKRTTPKMMHRAGELRHEQTPAEAKLWAYLRAGRTNGIGFRRQHATGRGGVMRALRLQVAISRAGIMPASTTLAT